MKKTKEETKKELFDKERYPHSFRDVEVLSDEYYKPHWANIKEMVKNGELIKDAKAGVIFLS